MTSATNRHPVHLELNPDRGASTDFQTKAHRMICNALYVSMHQCPCSAILCHGPHMQMFMLSSALHVFHVVCILPLTPLHVSVIHRQALVRRQRRPAIPRNMPDLATMEERHIITTFRLDRQAIHDLCDLLIHDLTPGNRNRHVIPPLVQVMAVLHFLASGSYQHMVGICGGMSQPKFSGVLRTFLSALLRHMETYIQFPRPQDLVAVKGDFFGLGGIPHVVGSIDGTHVALVPPRDVEHMYYNRKHYHSINVLLVCLADNYISHVTASLPGSAHDAHVLRASSVPQKMAPLLPHRAWLVGDSGYPNGPTLLTPLRNPNTYGERRYNVAHGQTRRVIERTNGILKARFRCLDRTGGAMMYKPGKVCRIIVACCMLHNIAVRRRLPLPAVDDGGGPPPDDGDGDGDDRHDGHEDEDEDPRRQLIANYFD